MEEKDKIVTIKVKLGTRARLKASKRGGESYEDVITKMLYELDYPKEYLKRKEEEERERGVQQ